MTEKTITAIEKGSGQGATYYKLNDTITEIRRFKKPIEFNADGITKEIEAYRVYSKSGIVCEIESNSGITLWF